MKKRLFKTLFTTLFLSLSISTAVFAKELVSENDITVSTDLQTENLSGIEGYIERMYQICLDRTPDAEGKAYWIQQLQSGAETGVHSAYGFVFSEEFKNKNLCNEVFVEYLYRAFMGREADDDGKNYWIGQLESGKKREEVFNGFALSDEFKVICNEYGIQVGEAIPIPTYGTVPTGKCTVTGKDDGATIFVTRMYNVCLDRELDSEGLEYWRNSLYNHTKSGKDVAYDFVFSKEFRSKRLTNGEFVDYMYKAFFGREADAEGKAYWIKILDEAKKELSREEVFKGFVESQEFCNLCNRCGIVEYFPEDHVHTFGPAYKSLEGTWDIYENHPTGTYYTYCKCGYFTPGTDMQEHTKKMGIYVYRSMDYPITNIYDYSSDIVEEKYIWGTEEGGREVVFDGSLINYNYLTRYLNPDNHEYSGYNDNEVGEEYDFRLVKERGLILDSNGELNRGSAYGVTYDPRLGYTGNPYWKDGPHPIFERTITVNCHEPHIVVELREGEIVGETSYYSHTCTTCGYIEGFYVPSYYK